MKLNKDTITDIKFNISKNTNIKFNKKIVQPIQFFISGFANITGITIRSTLEASMNVLFRINSKFSILSTTQASAIVSLISKKIFQISSTLEANTLVNLNMTKKFEIFSTLESKFGKDTILNQLDNLTLDEMDIFTLGELDFTEGINFILKKYIYASSELEAITTVALSGYYYNKLFDLDNLILSEMDDLTLDELDRVLL